MWMEPNRTRANWVRNPGSHPSLQIDPPALGKMFLQRPRALKQKRATRRKNTGQTNHAMTAPTAKVACARDAAAETMRVGVRRRNGPAIEIGSPFADVTATHFVLQATVRGDDTGTEALVHDRRIIHAQSSDKVFASVVAGALAFIGESAARQPR